MRKTIELGTAAAALFALLFCSSCDSFLDTSPISAANVKDFYRNADDVEKAVNAAYSGHKDIFTENFAAQHVLDEARSDNTRFGEDVVDVADRFIRDSGKEWWLWSWDNSYRAIYLSNIVVSRAPQVEMSEDLRNRYLAEVRFLRAITYFELVRNFGAVPLVTSETTSFADEDINVPRAPVDEVYQQIVEDLQFAAEHLPARYGEEADIGRATEGAALAFLGEVYLTRGMNSQAEAVLRDVVALGQYQLMEDYSELWVADNGNHAESVFELQYQANQDAAPHYNLFGSRGATEIPGGGFHYNLATDDLVNAYEQDDLRRDATLAEDDNGIHYTIKFDDENMTSGFNSDQNFPLMRYADVLLMLAEAIGESAESYELINRVRRRAGLGDVGSDTPGTFSEKLLHERRVELAFENHRWHDLLRFGVALEVMNEHLAQFDLTVSEDDLLMPLPFQALLNNPNLVQNPGY